LAFANVMRPLAVPALGGVFSAVMLFNLCVVPAYPVQSKPAVDVQTPLMTEAWLKDQLAEEAASGSFAMDILVDDMGRMAGYAFDSDHSLDDNARRKLVDILSRSKFQPATKFGKPKMSKIRLHLVQVKG
jgi:hypothetical protein